MSRIANVTFEEVLVKTVAIEVPDDVSDGEVLKWAIDKAKEMYKNEEVVLTADDKHGDTTMEVVDHQGYSTGWLNV